MLKINAQNFLDLGAIMSDMTIHFSLRRNEANSAEKNARYDREFGEDLSRIFKMCRDLGLTTSVELIEPRLSSIPKTEGEFDLLLEVIGAELKGKSLLYLSPHVAQYYEWQGIVSDKVVDAFPKASEEVRTAGNCLAVGMYTAGVFHSMRAAEIGLRALGAHAGVTLKNGKPLELGEWREILDGLSAEALRIENLPNTTPDKESNSHFFSEACAQFRFFKSGWRVRAAHARATYTEAQAKEAIDHVRSFFEVLAERIKEP